MHVAPTIYGVLRFSPSHARTRPPPPSPPLSPLSHPHASFLPSLFISRPHAWVYLPSVCSFRLVPSIRRSLSVRLPKSRQHLASSILGEIQADILSRAITVTFDHRMTGEWLTLRHQSMNFSLSARYNLQSARWPSRRPSPDSLGLTRHTQPAVSFPFSFSYFFPLPLS